MPDHETTEPSSSEPTTISEPVEPPPMFETVLIASQDREDLPGSRRVRGD